MTNSITLPSGVPSYEANAAAAAAPKNSLGTSAAETQDTFMKLLLAQIRNQDPLNPQDPAQMTSQLSQLNMASGIEKLNTRISSMLDQVSGQSFVDNASLIGRQVLMSGNRVQLGAAGGADFGVTLDKAVAQSVLQVRAADGALVDEISLGALDAGSHTFTWDGDGYDGRRAPAGAYTLSLGAVDGAAVAVGSTLLTFGKVAAVQRDALGPRLLLSDGRTVAASEIIQFKP